jgi:acetate kinase
MGVETLTLIANPGSASRKYALYHGQRCLAQLHFEYAGEAIMCTLAKGNDHQAIPVALTTLDESAEQVTTILRNKNILKPSQQIARVGLRVVAPSAFFLRDRVIDDGTIAQLEAMERRAPLHIRATLSELRILRKSFVSAEIIGISDSAFHVTKPDYAWNYGIPLKDADQLDIKRFGYHGLSAGSVVHALHEAEKLPPKVIICHLGSGASITAVRHGKSMDTTMGYSPLEGVTMATRSGTIDPTAVKVLRDALGMDDEAVQEYLNKSSGLLGLSGRSSDIRELLRFEAEGDHHAHLALQTYVHNIQKAIGQMAAVLEGVDLLVFSGTVGERSDAMRERIVRNLHYLDFMLDSKVNKQATEGEVMMCISKLAHSKPVFVVPANESAEMARRTAAFSVKANNA